MDLLHANKSIGIPCRPKKRNPKKTLFRHDRKAIVFGCLNHQESNAQIRNLGNITESTDHVSLDRI